MTTEINERNTIFQEFPFVYCYLFRLSIIYYNNKRIKVIINYYTLYTYF